MKVYAVDDEHFMLEALLEAIQQALPEAEVYGFRRAYELLEAFKKEPCEIAFLDIQMPVMNGLTLAKELFALKEKVNIIFVTGYDQYKADAMDMYASAYLMKPATVANVQAALKHLRYQVQQTAQRYFAVTFGNFSLYVAGKLVTFHRRKSAELLAYLVAKGGTLVSRAELTLALYEDEMHTPQSRKNLDNALHTLREDLAAVQAEEILYRGSDGLAVNRALLESDLYAYQNGKRQLYQGQFMEQYSWSEYFKGKFMEA